MKDVNKTDTARRIDPTILSVLMDSGRGKRKDRLQIKAKEKNSDITSSPSKVWDKMKEGTKWKNTELAAVTGIDRQTIGDIRKGTYKTKSGSTSYLIDSIAEALDVDPDYLTGDQKTKRKKKQTPEDLKRIQKDQEDLVKGRKLRILADFMKIYSLHVKYDNAAVPQKYWLYDADGEMIRNGDDIKDLDPLLDIVMNHLRTGSNILNLFFEDMWIDEL